MGACDDMAHSQNEKLDRRNYIEIVSLKNLYIKLKLIKKQKNYNGS